MHTLSAMHSSRPFATRIAAIAFTACGAIPALAVDMTADAAARDGEGFTFPRCPLGVNAGHGRAEAFMSAVRPDPCRVPPPPLPRFPV